MKLKTTKYRAGSKGRTYGRGANKTGRGSTGGAGKSGKWSHKLIPEQIAKKPRYVSADKLKTKIKPHLETIALRLGHTPNSEKPELITLNLNDNAIIKFLKQLTSIRFNFSKILGNASSVETNLKIIHLKKCYYL